MTGELSGTEQADSVDVELGGLGWCHGSVRGDLSPLPPESWALSQDAVCRRVTSCSLSTSFL